MPHAPRTSARPLDDWFTAGRFAALLGILLAACFPMVLIGQDAFAYLDSGQFAYPVAFHHREAFWRGELPLWNPLNSCGLPFLAQWNTLALYPVSLFYLLLPMPWSFGVFCLGHLFFAGMGLYFLARKWTGNQLAAAVAGAVFAFNGLTWYGVMWPHLIAALSWMPWIVLAMERAWRDGRRALLVAGVVGAVQLLSGGAEVIIQTWLLLGVLWLAHFFRGEISRGRLVSRALMIGLMAGGIAAIQLLPFLDLLRHSQRDTGYSSSEIGAVATMPLTGFFNYLVPLFHCAKNPQGVFVQSGQTWTGSYYLGATVVVLALLAVWRVRNGRVTLLSILTVISLLLALGRNGFLLEALKHVVPMFAFMRFPVKFLFLATFTLPLLAAYGLNWLQSLPAEKWSREWKKIIGLPLAVIVAIGFIAWLTAQHPLVDDEASFVSANALMRVIFLALIAAGIVLLRLDMKPRQKRVIQTAIVAFFWIDVYTHSSNLSPTVSAATLEPNAIRTAFNWTPPPDPGVSRVMQSKESFWGMLSKGSPDLDVDVRTRRFGQFLNYNLLDQVAKLDGFYSLDLRDYLDLFKRVYFTTNEASGLKDFLGIAQVNPATNLVSWIPRPTALPMITAGQTPVFSRDDETLAVVMSDRFAPAHTVYLPLEAQAQIYGKGAEAKVSSLKFSAHRVEFEVEAYAAAMTVIAQNYYHAWHAYVDEQPVPLWKANYAFQALEVPAGKHRVVLCYEDQAFRWGLCISLVTLLIAAVCWALCRTRKGGGA